MSPTMKGACRSTGESDMSSDESDNDRSVENRHVAAALAKADRLVGQVHNSPGARAQSSEEQFSQDAWGPADLVPDYYKFDQDTQQLEKETSFVSPEPPPQELPETEDLPIDLRLCTWLEDLGLEFSVWEKLAREGITSETISMLTHDQLHHLGVLRLGDRVKLFARAAQHMEQFDVQRQERLVSPAPESVRSHPAPETSQGDTKMAKHSPEEAHNGDREDRMVLIENGNGDSREYLDVVGAQIPRVQLVQFEGVLECTSFNLTNGQANTTSVSSRGGVGDDKGQHAKDAKDKSGGIGIQLQTDSRGICRVMRLQPGGAAHKSGLIKEGDAVLEIDTMPAAALSTQQLRSRVCGRPGSSVALLIRRRILGDEGHVRTSEETVFLEREVMRVSAAVK